MKVSSHNSPNLYKIIYGTFALIERGEQESLTYLHSYPGLFSDLDEKSLETRSPDELMPQILNVLNAMQRRKVAPPTN